MITKNKTPRYFGKRTAKRIKRTILSKFPSVKVLAEEINENPAYVRNIVNGISRSLRVAKKIEEAVGEKLFPYTEER